MANPLDTDALAKIQLATAHGETMAEIERGNSVRLQGELDAARIRTAGATRRPRSSNQEIHLRGTVGDLRLENMRQRNALADKELLLQEWMRRSQAFERLALRFGQRAGLSEVDVASECEREIASLSTPDPAA